MPSYSRSLRVKAAEINGSPVESVPEKSLLRKATETPPRRPTRENECIVLFIYISETAYQLDLLVETVDLGNDLLIKIGLDN